jgi:hypothetical protein
MKTLELTTENTLHQEYKKGILYLVWGWPLFLSQLSSYLLANLSMSFWIQDTLTVIKNTSFLVGLIITLYLFFSGKIKLNTRNEYTLLIVWAAFVGALVMINLILYNHNGELNQSLQNPIFMIVFCFASIVTSRLTKSIWIMVAAFLFAVATLISSAYTIREQLLINAFCWLILFLIPGHLFQILSKIEGRKQG